MFGWPSIQKMFNNQDDKQQHFQLSAQAKVVLK